MAKTLEERVEDLERVIKAMGVVLVGGNAGTPSGPGGFATDYEMSGKYADFDVKFEPRDWKGPPMKGRKASRCDPNFLDMLAESFDYFGGQSAAKGTKDDKGRDKAPFEFKNARIARTWAKRLREGWTPAENQPGGQTHVPRPAPVPPPTRAPAPYGLSGAGSSLKHTGTPEPADPFGAGPVADGEFDEVPDDIPFLTCAPVPARHVRMPRWERF